MTRRRDSQRGQGLVEMALVMPLFILALIGIFDLGRFVYSYNTISNAAREAMRVAIVNQDMDTVETRALDHAVALGLTVDDVEVVYVVPPSLALNCSSPVDIGCIAEITVHYHFTPATPLIGNLLGTLDINSVSRAPVERTYDP